jgi:hypothetical protein
MLISMNGYNSYQYFSYILQAAMFMIYFTTLSVARISAALR